MSEKVKDASALKQNEKNLGDVDVKTKRELYEKNQELKVREDEIATLKAELEFFKNQPAVPVPTTNAAPDLSLVDQLRNQVEILSRQVMGLAPNASKLMFREPNVHDLVPEGEEITFTSRSVLYVVASYRDHRGIEKLPPHKLIIFQYAASDIRKEGREEQVVNFSQYTTNLKTEIEFLRSHPYYGITFGENTTEMVNEDINESRYKITAATQLSTMPPEVIFDRAKDYKIPNFRSKSAEQLRHLIVSEMAKEFKAENKRQLDDIIRRQALRHLVNNDKDNQ